MRTKRVLLVLAVAACFVTSCGARRTTPVVPAPQVVPPISPSGKDGGVDAGQADASPPVVPPLPPVPTAVPFLRGVNLSGAEFGSAFLGTEGIDYSFPTEGDVDYFASMGMNFVRVPFMHERMQHVAGGAIDEAYWNGISKVVARARSRGMVVALESHGGVRYWGSVVTKEAFGDLWGRIAERTKGDPGIWLDLANEPHDVATEEWVGIANEGIRRIRGAGSTSRILVAGNGWDGAWTWSSSWYGTPNAIAMKGIVDPKKNVAFEVHQYLDPDGGGGAGECASRTIGVSRIAGFTQWLRQEHQVGFLGEVGSPSTATCAEAVRGLLDAVEGARDAYLGWAWWGGGSAWPSTYPLFLGPAAPERAQVGWLRPFLGRRP